MLSLLLTAALSTPMANTDFTTTRTPHGSWHVPLAGNGGLDIDGDPGVFEQSSRPCEPMFLGYPHGPRTADWAPANESAVEHILTVQAGEKRTLHLAGSGSSLACTTDPHAPLISTLGGAVAVGSNAVYNRHGDWLVSTDDADVVLKAVGNQFEMTVHGPCHVTVKDSYYRNHLGYFLWDSRHALHEKPIAGWCSWAAYGQDINEGEVVKAAEFFGRNLREYGYDVIQIDDGYQRVLQLTDNHQPITEPFAHYWTKPNDRFPSGMKALASTITANGMVPGIWIGLYLPMGLRHSNAYVTDDKGKPLQGPWVGYSMDSGQPAAVREAYTDTITEFRKTGWRYFKIDTLRHVLYDSYRRNPSFWTARGTDSSHAFRLLFEQVRQAVGEDNYLLACWGALPELAGLADGCRIGEDVGPSFASMRKAAKYIAQFHYANNVVWKSDPDYMCFRVSPEECKTWATLTSLTGGHVMVSDPIETYDREKVDILRRVGPPATVRPGNAGPMAPDPEWLHFHGTKGSDAWTVVARMAWTALPEARASLPSLGVASDGDYLAFDFWSSKFLGVVRGTVDFRSLEPGHCQVVGLRRLTGAPQVLGDDRHVSQGAEELDAIAFSRNRLSGRFARTSDKSWNLFLYVPDHWHLRSADLEATQVESHVVRLTIPAGSGWQKWSADFVHAN